MSELSDEKIKLAISNPDYMDSDDVVLMALELQSRRASDNEKYTFKVIAKHEPNEKLNCGYYITLHACGLREKIGGSMQIELPKEKWDRVEFGDQYNINIEPMQNRGERK